MHNRRRMKGWWSLVLALTLACGVSGVKAQGTPPAFGGDLNGNGVIDLPDVILSLQFALQAASPSDAQACAGDVNADGALNLKDTLQLLQWAVGVTSRRINPPHLTGWLAFRRGGAHYETGAIYLYNFATGQLINRTENMPDYDTENPNASPDGRYLTFMGRQIGDNTRAGWDLYVATVVGNERPINLTKGDGVPDEDPKFFDNDTIVFKYNGEIAFMDLATDANGNLVMKDVRLVTIGTTPEDEAIERSVPGIMHPAQGSPFLVFQEGAQGNSDIYRSGLDGRGRAPVAALPGIEESYPQAWDADRLLYTQWLTASILNAQVMVHRFSVGQSCPMPFDLPDQNASDPAPIDHRLIFFSSTGRGGNGIYDLYVGDTLTGQVWSMSDLAPAAAINSPDSELGAVYFNPASATNGTPTHAQVQAEIYPGDPGCVSPSDYDHLRVSAVK